MLSKKERDMYLAKDAVELFMQLSVFEIDTIILIHEGREHEFQLILEVMRKKYDHRRIVVVSMNHRQKWYERYASTRNFFATLEE